MKTTPFTLLLLTLALPGLAQKSEEPPLVWQSNNNTVKELTREFADLYRNILVLDTHGRKVPTRTVQVPPGKTITEVLREQGLFVGKDLPRQLDVLACRLNRDVCRVKPGASGEIGADDATAGWRLRPGGEIRVPDIQFIELTVHKPYEKRAGDTLKTIVVDERQGCGDLDAKCVQYVENLNRRAPEALNTEYAGKIVVPTKAYRAIIRVTRDEDDDTQADLVKMAPKLGDRVIPPAKASRHDSHATTPVQGSRSLVLKLIHHPLSKDPALSLPPTARSHVAVFDTWVDNTHCLLANVTVLNPDGLGGAVDRAGSCGDAGSATEASDHGTHVVGLIGMRLGGIHGPGINPYASIRVVCVKYDEFAKPLYLAKQADRLRDLYRTDAPDVVNLSFEYRTSTENGRNDVFHNAIRDQEGDTLFVVSAGNDRAELQSRASCDVQPACYDGKNVVTVGALDLGDEDPRMMETDSGGSNYGDRVHLAAPGKNILSTLAGDRLGPMTGTSQAAPTVAGAASLLYLYERKLRPAQVKNRLIYTSELFPALYSKMQGGRLNVERLLAYKKAQVRAAGRDAFEALGTGSARQDVSFADFDGGPDLILSWAQVRRLMFNPGLGYYTLYYNDDVGRDTGPLVRRFVTLKDPGANVSFRVETQPGEPDRKVDVRLADIVDYVSPLLL